LFGRRWVQQDRLEQIDILDVTGSQRAKLFEKYGFIVK
jgi:hypothetical protein